MAIIQIQKASRTAAHLLISLSGPSGSGKTYSALQLARGIVGPTGKIGVLDTESGRANLYADTIPGGFDAAVLSSPFTPDRYRQAVREFEEAGYDILIIDSFSHEWSGTGGVLEMADEIEANSLKAGKKGVGLQKWLKPKLEHRKLMNTLLSTRMHIIFCLRSKAKMKPAKDDRGRDIVVNDGLVEVTSSDFVYEMTVAGMLQSGGRLDFATAKIPAFLRPAFVEGQPLSIETGRAIVRLMGDMEPVDAAWERVKRQAQDAAEAGTATLEGFWNTLTLDHKRRLKPDMANLKSIAVEVDRAAEAEVDEPHGQANAA